MAEDTNLRAGTEGARPAPRVFVRDATGLTKEIGVFDIFVYNTNNQNIGIGVAFLILFVPAFYPGASMIWTTVISAAIALPLAAVYAYFATIIPRSGGDYVYNSRVLHPALGFMSGWNWVAWMTVYIGIPAAYFAQYGLTGLFRMLGAALGSPRLVQIGNDFSTRLGTFLAGTALILLFGFIFWRGTRLYFRIQNSLFGIATFGLFAVLAVLLTTDHAKFLSHFNQYVSSLGGSSNAAAHVVNAARGAGYATSPAFSWSATLHASVWPLFIVLFAITSSFLGGEVREARRTQFAGMPGSVVYVTLWMILLIALVVRIANYNFLGAIGFLTPDQLGKATNLSFAPTYNELVGTVVSGSAWAVAFLGLSFAFWTYVWLPINYLASTRAMLAWSFDRTFPEKVSYVNPRTNTPTWAIVLVGILGEISLIAYVRGWLATISGIFGWLISFIITCIAAAVFPYRRPELFESSPFNWRIGRIPVITIVAVLAIAGLVVAEYYYWVDPFVGVRVFPKMKLAIPGVLITGLAWYYGAKAVQRRRGIRIEQAFAEIPPV